MKSILLSELVTELFSLEACMFMDATELKPATAELITFASKTHSKK